MRSPDIAHYSTLLADLQVAAARATSVEQLGEIREETRQAFADIFGLLSHDALESRDMVAALAAEARRSGNTVAVRL